MISLTENEFVKQETKSNMEQKIFSKMVDELKFINNNNVPVGLCEEIEIKIPDGMNKNDSIKYVCDRIDTNSIYLKSFSGVDIIDDKNLSFFLVRVLPEHLETVLRAHSYFKDIDIDSYFWENVIDNIISIQIEKNYKKYWCVEKLTAIHYLLEDDDDYPDLEKDDLDYLGDSLDYKPGWGWFYSKKLRIYDE